MGVEDATDISYFMAMVDISKGNFVHRDGDVHSPSRMKRPVSSSSAPYVTKFTPAATAVHTRAHATAQSSTQPSTASIGNELHELERQQQEAAELNVQVERAKIQGQLNLTQEVLREVKEKFVVQEAHNRDMQDKHRQLQTMQKDMHDRSLFCRH